MAEDRELRREVRGPVGANARRGGAGRCGAGRAEAGRVATGRSDATRELGAPGARDGRAQGATRKKAWDVWMDKERERMGGRKGKEMKGRKE
jgi:hypothetical protein